MLKIRLKRCGRKKSPSYRIILTPSQSKRDGKALVEFGYYNPLTKDLKFDGEIVLDLQSTNNTIQKSRKINSLITIYGDSKVGIFYLRFYY